MANAGITERLARISARRPWLVLGAWALVFVVGAYFAAGIGDVTTTDDSISVNTQSLTGSELIEERLHAEEAHEFVIVQSQDLTVGDAEFEEFVQALTGDLHALTGTTEEVANYYETHEASMVSNDGHTTVVLVKLAGDSADAEDIAGPLLQVVARANGTDGFEVLSAGDGSVSKAFTEASEEDLQRGEIISFPIAILVLLLVFGAVVAAGVPILIAVVSIIISIGISAIIGEFFDLSFFVVNMITMIGLAVGIDYSLFIIHRFRDERAAGLTVEDAVTKAGATASRAVLFSGITVIIALAGLFIVPTSIYRSLAIGATAVAAVSVLAALTLLPAVLRLLGDRINAIRPPFFGREAASDAGSHGFWDRVTTFVMAHPVASTAASVAILLIAAAPLLTLHLGMSGISSLPAGTDTRRAFEILDTEFAGGIISPTEIVIDGDIGDPQVRASIDDLMDALVADGSFSTPGVEQNDAGDLAVVSVAVNADPDSRVAHDAVNRVRDDYVPAAFAGSDASVYVTGQTAEAQDLLGLLSTYMPIVFAFVLGLSFLLLLVLFRSVVVPLKAVVMNLLSVAAAYGLLVLVFQHGIGNEIFGFQKSETIESWLPLFLFAVLFGLSMDYHVFLLSRIKERFDETGDNTGAVAYGMRSTSGLITGAALIMVTVFSGFALGSLSSLQQMGVGLAVAVVLDATIIRCVLVPASMQLLGNRNWYLPNWLSWLPQISIEGAPTQPAPATTTA
jgi:RND superfamily putative drug exporter